MSAQLKSSIKYPGSLIRPRFEPGALLLDEDLTAIVDHTRGLSRLLFRSLFGCGVVCGFRVTAQVECGNLTVAVAPGVALDCKGDPIEMSEQQTLGMLCAEKLPDRLWVLIRRSARDHTCATRDVVCPSDDGGGAYKPTRAKDCFELTLTKDEPQHECGCPPPPQLNTQQRMEISGTDTGTTALAAPAASAGNLKVAAGSENIVVEKPAGSEGIVTEKARVDAVLSPPADWECHIPHYCGVCACGCCDSCGDGWVVLARVSTKARIVSGAAEPPRERDVDYKVRRFIRPVLAADPLRDQRRDVLCKQLLAANPDGH